jgi:hypothetical protein
MLKEPPHYGQVSYPAAFEKWSKTVTVVAFMLLKPCAYKRQPFDAVFGVVPASRSGRLSRRPYSERTAELPIKPRGESQGSKS